MTATMHTIASLERSARLVVKSRVIRYVDLNDASLSRKTAKNELYVTGPSCMALLT
jgi:hypothetical protein